MLEVRKIQQWFRTGFWLKPAVILRDVSLVVPRGSITGFLGPNGAGKTTLIQLIAGIRRPKGGSIHWKGISTLEPEARARIGYLPERPYFHEHLSGRRLLEYFGRLSRLSERELSSRIPQLLERVGLGHAGDRALGAYSKGMLQRIGIAQALIHDPEFLLLDEPMSGLDPVGRAEMRRIIIELGREGRTIFFSSHIVHDVETICDRVALMDQGRIVTSGSISELLADGQASSEIRFRAAAESALGSLGILHEKTPDGGFVATIPSSKVNESLERLLKAGARVVSVEPRHSSLESWFRRPGPSAP